MSLLTKKFLPLISISFLTVTTNTVTVTTALNLNNSNRRFLNDPLEDAQASADETDQMADKAVSESLKALDQAQQQAKEQADSVDSDNTRLEKGVQSARDASLKADEVLNEVKGMISQAVTTAYDGALAAAKDRIALVKKGEQMTVEEEYQAAETARLQAIKDAEMASQPVDPAGAGMVGADGLPIDSAGGAGTTGMVNIDQHIKQGYNPSDAYKTNAANMMSNSRIALSEASKLEQDVMSGKVAQGKSSVKEYQKSMGMKAQSRKMARSAIEDTEIGEGLEKPLTDVGMHNILRDIESGELGTASLIQMKDKRKRVENNDMPVLASTRMLQNVDEELKQMGVSS